MYLMKKMKNVQRVPTTWPHTVHAFLSSYVVMPFECSAMSREYGGRGWNLEAIHTHTHTHVQHIAHNTHSFSIILTYCPELNVHAFWNRQYDVYWPQVAMEKSATGYLQTVIIKCYACYHNVISSTACQHSQNVFAIISTRYFGWSIFLWINHKCLIIMLLHPAWSTLQSPCKNRRQKQQQ